MNILGTTETITMSAFYLPRERDAITYLLPLETIFSAAKNSSGTSFLLLSENDRIPPNPCFRYFLARSLVGWVDVPGNGSMRQNFSLMPWPYVPLFSRISKAKEGKKSE